MLSNRIIVLLVIGILLIFFRKQIIFLYHKLRVNGAKSNDVINSPTSPPINTEHFDDNFIPSKTFQGEKDNYVFKTMVYRKSDNNNDNKSLKGFTAMDNPYTYKTGYYYDGIKINDSILEISLLKNVI